MEKKVIYENPSSRAAIKFDGEMIIIEQELDGLGLHHIHLYPSEFEECIKFFRETYE